MTASLPVPVRLEQPPGSLAALDELVSASRVTADRLAGLREHLAGPAASAPGWLGDDATAATAQIAAVATIAGTTHDAVRQVADRLSVHASLLRDVRMRIAALRAEQDDDFAGARGRLLPVGSSPLSGLGGGSPGGPSMILALGEELRAAEARRERQHRALLHEVDADSRATAAVLAASAAVVGGTGAPGDADRVVARFARELPGWGQAELATRAGAFARLLSGQPSAVSWEAQASARLPYADDPGFAEALLTGLGKPGFERLLFMLDRLSMGADSALARLVATVVGAAGSSATPPEAVRNVLLGCYLAPKDDSPWSDSVAIGLATVLLAGVRAVRPVPAETALVWGQQAIAREESLRAELPRNYRVGGRLDPVVGVVQVLARAGNRKLSAELLARTGTWQALLERSWSPNDRPALKALVAQAALEPGALGGAAARAGIQALGTGLGETGDPKHWQVDPRTAAAVSPALGEVVGRHLDAVVPLLVAAASGNQLDVPHTAALRGLGYLTLDPQGSAVLQEGIERWTSGRPTVAHVGSSGPSPVVAVRAGVVAVREYAQRLAYALHGFELAARAEDRHRPFLALETALALVPGRGAGRAGGPAGAALPAVEKWAGTDGEWNNGLDTGPRFAREDAEWAVRDRLTPEEMPRLHEVVLSTWAAFTATNARLGTPRPPHLVDVDVVGSALRRHRGPGPRSDSGQDAGAPTAGAAAHAPATSLRAEPSIGVTISPPSATESCHERLAVAVDQRRLCAPITGSSLPGAVRTETTPCPARDGCRTVGPPRLRRRHDLVRQQHRVPFHPLGSLHPLGSVHPLGAVTPRVPTGILPLEGGRRS